MRLVFTLTILTAAAVVAASQAAVAGALEAYPVDGLFFSATETSLLFDIPVLPPMSDSFDTQFAAVFQTGFHDLLNEPPPADDYDDARSRPLTIPAPPATGLLILQGMLCVGLLKGRQKWAAAFVAAMALGRAGIEALPRNDFIRARRNQAAPAAPLDAAGWQQHLQPSKTYYPDIFAGMRERLSERDTVFRAGNIKAFLEREVVLFDAHVDAERFFHASRSVLLLAPDHSLKSMTVDRVHWARPPPC